MKHPILPLRKRPAGRKHKARIAYLVDSTSLLRGRTSESRVLCPGPRRPTLQPSIAGCWLPSASCRRQSVLVHSPSATHE
jgi:hypothetical protein